MCHRYEKPRNPDAKIKWDTGRDRYQPLIRQNVVVDHPNTIELEPAIMDGVGNEAQLVGPLGHTGLMRRWFATHDGTELKLLDGAVTSSSLPSGLIRRTRTTYAGPFEVGEDLMQIDVTASPVVRHPQPIRY